MLAIHNDESLLVLKVMTNILLMFYGVSQHICYSAYMPWQFRLSVCPSVTRVDQSKAFEVRIMQFSPYSSPIPLVSAR